KWIPRSKKDLAKKRAIFHSDNTGSTRFYCSTNGKREWILTFQNTERRSSKNELRKFMLDEDYEVMVSTNKPFTDYWD
ncbi:hypothetical protein ACI3PL_26690, partial [Lacticaseibacillus paracasei]